LLSPWTSALWHFGSFPQAAPRLVDGLATAFLSTAKNNTQ
jgi:hypothetical protein